jgi:hypothetical protein
MSRLGFSLAHLSTGFVRLVGEDFEDERLLQLNYDPACGMRLSFGKHLVLSVVVVLEGDRGGERLLVVILLILILLLASYIFLQGIGWLRPL